MNDVSWTLMKIMKFQAWLELRRRKRGNESTCEVFFISFLLLMLNRFSSLVLFILFHIWFGFFKKPKSNRCNNRRNKVNKSFGICSILSIFSLLHCKFKQHWHKELFLEFLNLDRNLSSFSKYYKFLLRFRPPGTKFK